MIRSQRLLSFFEVSCPISCYFYRNFSYPHKHNVIQTAEVTTALGWPWDERELPPLPFFPCLGVPTAPSPHSSAGSEQHLQETWLFLLFLGVTGSLIPTVFIAVPQCCLTREGWALLLPHRDTGVGCWLQMVPPQHLPLTQTAAGCRTPWGAPAASTAQLHSQPVHPALLALDIFPSLLLQPQPALNDSHPVLLPLSHPQLGLLCPGS